MTLKKRYDEIMDKIEVTGEMRSRILQNVQQANLAAKPESKVLTFRMMKRYLSVAACFAVLLIGGFTVPHLLNLEQGTEPGVMEPGGIVTVSSLEELTNAVGFDVEEIDNLSFVSEEQEYVAYWGDMAQITYMGEGKTAIFRKSKGNEDNSGDYNSYSSIQEISAGDITVTLKGDSEAFTLAIWSDDGFSYSIQLSDGQSATEWVALVSEIHEQ